MPHHIPKCIREEYYANNTQQLQAAANAVQRAKRQLFETSSARPPALITGCAALAPAAPPRRGTVIAAPLSCGDLQKAYGSVKRGWGRSRASQKPSRPREPGEAARRQRGAFTTPGLAGARGRLSAVPAASTAAGTPNSRRQVLGHGVHLRDGADSDTAVGQITPASILSSLARPAAAINARPAPLTERFRRLCHNAGRRRGDARPVPCPGTSPPPAASPSSRPTAPPSPDAA